MLGLVLSYLLTAVARQIAPGLGFIDRPDCGRKAHAQPTPLLGGLALLLGLLGTTGLGAAMNYGWLNGTVDRWGFVTAVLMSAAAFGAVGLLDDRYSLRPRTKLLWQILAALPFVLWGRSVESVHLLGLHVELAGWGASFTVLWLVACANAVNLLDGMDGLAGTFGLIVAVSVALHSGLRDQFALLSLSLLISACLLGFLLHNWPPARIFLGDSGSLSIGFLVGALSLESGLKTATGLALSIPLVLISVPVFDTLMAIVRRKLSGRSIGRADRAHIHHLLQARGLSSQQSLIVISGLCISMAAATLLSAWFQNDIYAVVICLTVISALIVARVFGYDETRLVWRRVRGATRLLNETTRWFRWESILARFELEGTAAGECWDVLTRCAADCGAAQLEFSGWSPEGELVQSLTWNSLPAQDSGLSSGGNAEPSCADGNLEQWSYRFEMENSGIRTQVQVAGSSDSKPITVASRIERLLVTFCRNWQPPEPLELSSEEPDTIRMPDVTRESLRPAA